MSEFFKLTTQVESIKAEFPQLEEKEKFAVVAQLTRLGGQIGARAVMELLHKYATTPVMPNRILQTINIRPEQADVYFPSLLNYISIPEFSIDVYRLCDYSLSMGFLSPMQTETIYEVIITKYREAKQLCLTTQTRTVQNNPDLEMVDELFALLSLLRCFNKPEVVEELYRAIESLTLMHLKFAAVNSLWHLGREAPDETLLMLIANDHYRPTMYWHLHKTGRLSLFPQQFRTPDAFARSILLLSLEATFNVHPNLVELMKIIVVTKQQTQEMGNYYVYRIFTDLGQMHENEWVAAWVGPIPLQFDFMNWPTQARAWSDGDPWEYYTPEEHVLNYLRITAPFKNFTYEGG